MAVLATIAFATLLLEDDYLLALYKRLENLANHLGTLYGGGTYFYCVVGFSEEHTVKFYCVTFFVSIAEIVNIQELLRLCWISTIAYICYFVVLQVIPSGEQPSLFFRPLLRHAR